MKQEKMKHLGLFEGIGGFSLAARWMGWETVAWCEWNEFCQKVLKYHFPEAEGYSDITKTDFTKYKNAIDIISGGFPCQPYSIAGKRKGTNDDRHLWPEMLRAIREVRPPWVVGENVLGLVNWSDGLVFEQVQADLEAEGYEVQPYILPASGVGAPHRRYRVWFVAYNHERVRKEVGLQTGREVDVYPFEDEGNATNPNGGERCERGLYQEGIQKTKRHIGAPCTRDSRATWENFPTEATVCDGDNGLSSRLDGITLPKWRSESIKAGGNAIVPQVALQIFKAIEQYEFMKPESG